MDDGQLGPRPIGVESLGAVEYPNAAFGAPIRRGAGAGGIGTGLRLGQTPGANPFTGGEPRQIAALLFLVAGEQHVTGAQRVVRRHAESDGGVDARHLLDHRHVLHRAQPGAAVLLRDGGAQEPELGDLLHKLVWKRLRLVPFTHIRLNHLLGEAANGRGDEALLFADDELQGASGRTLRSIDRDPRRRPSATQCGSPRYYRRPWTVFTNHRRRTLSRIPRKPSCTHIRSTRTAC